MNERTEDQANAAFIVRFANVITHDNTHRRAHAFRVVFCSLSVFPNWRGRPTECRKVPTTISNLRFN